MSYRDGSFSGGKDTPFAEYEAAKVILAIEVENAKLEGREPKTLKIGHRTWVWRPLAVEGAALPQGSQDYMGLLEQMRALHLAKAAGYAGQDAVDVWTNFREAENWGSTALAGCLIRLGDKFRRLQNLTRDPSNDQVGESFDDTAMDLAAYALIAICLRRETDLSQSGASENPHTD